MMRAAAAVSVRAITRPLAAAAILWRFSRPHTVIGTAVSVLGIFAIAAAELPGAVAGAALGDLALTLLAAVAVNVYIVGVNQIEDVAVDRINKPRLPLASGELTMEAARGIVTASAGLALALAVTQGWVELVAVGAAIGIGSAYSLPPLRLRRFPALAAASISIVRALVVNLGVYWHFADSLGARGEISHVPAAIVALTLFVLPFSLAIALLKDVPDTRGDRQFRIATFALRLGPRTTFRLGLAALSAAYLGMAAIAPFALGEANPWLLVAGHVVPLAGLWHWARAVRPADAARFTRFYMRVWGLFFLEYLLLPVAVIAG